MIFKAGRISEESRVYPPVFHSTWHIPAHLYIQLIQGLMEIIVLCVFKFFWLIDQQVKVEEVCNPFHFLLCIFFSPQLVLSSKYGQKIHRTEITQLYSHRINTTFELLTFPCKRRDFRDYTTSFGSKMSQKPHSKEEPVWHRSLPHTQSTGYRHPPLQFSTFNHLSCVRTSENGKPRHDQAGCPRPEPWFASLWARTGPLPS